LHNEELHDLDYSLHAARVIESRTMRWTGRVARRREKRHSYHVWWENLKDRDIRVEYLGVVAMIILNYIFKIERRVLEIGWENVDWIKLA
jgi:hypothetical protein